MIKNIQWCEKQLIDRGFTTEVLRSATIPHLYAESASSSEDLPQVLFYFHLDGQSVDPQFWFQDDPYQAVLKKNVEGQGWVDLSWDELTDEAYDPDWYVFARSASDSKNNFMTWLTAVDLLISEGKTLPYNLKLIIDFEEEKSSPSLRQMVVDNKDLLAADMLAHLDGIWPSIRTA